MAKNVAAGRASRSRFLRSRGGGCEVIDLPVKDFSEARELLTDLVSPQTPQLLSAQPFGGHPRLTFRFKPLPNKD